jgi:hypothetical protein
MGNVIQICANEHETAAVADTLSCQALHFAL